MKTQNELKITLNYLESENKVLVISGDNKYTCTSGAFGQLTCTCMGYIFSKKLPKTCRHLDACGHHIEPLINIKCGPLVAVDF